MKIIDLFCGCGGWDHAARNLGYQTIGIDNNKDAAQSARNAGGTVILADITTLNPKTFGKIDGLIASPPCTDFSRAGKRAGINGNTGQLMWEIPRWAEQTLPTWIACEQVPPALKWFQHFETILQPLGYNTWTGTLNAADYGVPQTRKRAILIAHLTQPVNPPPPTHTKNPQNTLLETPLQPWKTMAEALGWGMTHHPYRTIASSRTTGGPDKEKLGGSAARKFVHQEQQQGRWIVNTGADWKKNGNRTNAQQRNINQPAPTITTQSGHQWKINNQSGTNIDLNWPHTRPSTTIANRPLIPHPGTNKNRHNNATKSRNDGFKIETEHALTLQTFPPNYPLHGNKTSQFRQIGNAIPPQLAQHILQTLLPPNQPQTHKK